jgi:integrase/recombinase XerD
VIIRERKSAHPVKLPLPDETTRAIAAYIIGVRQKNAERHVFLSLRAPYAPLSARAVCFIITDALRSAGIKGSSYWLRHTYAQHLLETGASLYDIKQMLGHERLQSSKRYIHIHTNLMREVIFDETL